MLLLSERLPLRTTRMLGNFAEDVELPHRLGDLTSGRFGLIRLDDTTQFAADHPMQVTKVFIDRQETRSWERRLQSNGVGNTWTIVKFSAPIPIGAEVSACGIGNVNPRNGELIENPADIAEYIMRIAWREDRWWDDLRAEAAAEGIRLAGSLVGGQSIGAAIDEVLDSAGAIWCAGMARLYPVTSASGYIVPLTVDTASQLVVVRDIANTCDILRLSYDPDVARDTAQRSIELTANPMRFGGIVREQAANWIRRPSDAVSIGSRYLPWFAGRRVEIEFECNEPEVRLPGQWVRFVSHPEWRIPGPDPTAMVLEIDKRPASGGVWCRGVALLEAPEVNVTAHSVAIDVTRDASVEVTTNANGVTLVVRDANGAPIFNARVALNGGASLKTSADGSVTFTGITLSDPPKEYRLAIQAPGKTPTVQSVWL